MSVCLLLVTCGDMAAGGHFHCYVDTQGSVDVYKKGHCTKCVYTSTVAKAIYEVSEAIGAVVSVEKVRRCSDRGSYTADQISKGNLSELRRMMPWWGDSMVVPPSILSWLKDPRLDMNWSKSILSDMKKAGVEVISTTL